MAGVRSLGRLAKLMPPDTEYYGIDLPVRKRPAERRARDEFTLRAELDYRLLPAAGKSIFLLQMDARNLAFQDGVFDEAHMHLGTSLPRANVLVRTLVESARVLKTGGSCIMTGCQGRPDDGFGVEWLFLERQVDLVQDKRPGALERASVFCAVIREQVGLHASGFVVVARK